MFYGPLEQSILRVSWALVERLDKSLLVMYATTLRPTLATEAIPTSSLAADNALVLAKIPKPWGLMIREAMKCGPPVRSSDKYRSV